MSTPAPDRAAITEALTLLGAPPDALAAFPAHPDDLAFSFADALADAPPTIYTDWKYHPADALNEVWQRLYPHGVKGMIDEEDADTGFPKKIILQHNGIGTRYRITIKGDEPCLHDILFALDKVLPAELRIMSLRPYEATDTYLHVIQPAAVFARARELLGDWFDQVFAVHESPLAFTKTGGNVKPKRDLAKKWVNHARQWLALDEQHHKEDSEYLERVLNCTNIADLHRPFPGDSKKDRRASLEKFVARFPMPRRFYLLPMHNYADRIMKEAVIDVLEGRANGWERLHIGMRFEVLHKRFDQELGWDRKIDHVDDEGGRLLALAWALGDMTVVRWLSEELIRFPINFAGWRYTPLEPMLLQLYALWQNVEINWEDYRNPKLGVYRALFDAWNEPAKLPAALEMCCDYHLMRTGEFKEFGWPPYQILPAEILAVYRLREMQGLPTPRIEHPLMDTPLGVLPAPVRCPPDELLRKIIDTVSREHPEFDDWLRWFRE